MEKLVYPSGLALGHNEMRAAVQGTLGGIQGWKPASVGKPVSVQNGPGALSDGGADFSNRYEGHCAQSPPYFKGPTEMFQFLLKPEKDKRLGSKTF